MRPPEIVIDDFELRARPELSTGAPDLHPDLAPGEGQARDAGLDGAAATTTTERPLPAAGEPDGEARARAALDAAIEEARTRAATVTRVSFDPLPPPHNPLDDLRPPEDPPS